MCISRREPTPCGGEVSYAPPSCPGHHVHVEGSSLIAANTVSSEAGTTPSHPKRCDALSRKSRSTVRKRWAMPHKRRLLHSAWPSQIGSLDAAHAVPPHEADV